MFAAAAVDNVFNAESEPALFVDLDGTLIRSDLLWESLASAMRREPAGALRGVSALRGGRAALKHALANVAQIDLSRLPYRAPLIDWLRLEAARGRRIYLATAADATLANGVARHLGLFEEVIASDGLHNRKGPAKLEAIRAIVGDEPFDYAGNGEEDLPIFAAARQAIVAGAPPGVLRRAQRVGNVQRGFADPRTIVVWWRALRPHQWLKNLLLFVPLLTSFSLSQPALVMAELLAFLAFSMVASAGYLVNDVLDVQTDRKHPRKSRRPIAAGDIPISWALAVAVLLVIGAVALGSTLNAVVVNWLLIYLVLTFSYSLSIKRLAIFDIGMLAALYTTRVVTGGAAIDVPVSFWLLAFSAFLFFSLAILKRCGELVSWRDRGELTSEGRAYTVADLSTLQPLGIGTSVSAVLVFALYVQAPEVVQRYGSTQWLWLTLTAMMLWLARLWLVTNRGEMDDDPLVFAIREPVSLVLVAAMMAGFAVATLLR